MMKPWERYPIAQLIKKGNRVVLGVTWLFVAGAVAYGVKTIFEPTLQGGRFVYTALYRDVASRAVLDDERLVLAVTTVITSTNNATQTFNVPADWNNSGNNVWCLGPGGNGGSGSSDGASVFVSGGGGGGAASANTANISLTPGGTAPFMLTLLNPSGGGADTSFNTSSVIAKAGEDGTNGDFTGPTVGVGGNGGLASGSTGTTKFNGGNGGGGENQGAGASTGGGGGGCGGTTAAGSNGSSGGAGGGGGAGGADNGGAGGAGSGTAFNGTHGAGGGGNGGTDTGSPAAQTGGNYGGGGGGGGCSAGGNGSGAIGKQGLIAVTNFPPSLIFANPYQKAMQTLLTR